MEIYGIMCLYTDIFDWKKGPKNRLAGDSEHPFRLHPGLSEPSGLGKAGQVDEKPSWLMVFRGVSPTKRRFSRDSTNKKGPLAWLNHDIWGFKSIWNGGIMEYRWEYHVFNTAINLALGLLHGEYHNQWGIPFSSNQLKWGMPLVKPPLIEERWWRRRRHQSYRDCRRGREDAKLGNESWCRKQKTACKGTYQQRFVRRCSSAFRQCRFGQDYGHVQVLLQAARHDDTRGIPGPNDYR